MLKYAKVINQETKECQVGLGDNVSYYQSLGMSELDVKQGYNGLWYLSDYIPTEPAKNYKEKRMAEYPSLSEQLDMIYWDKVNGTQNWKNKISEIKTKYPKE